MMKNFSVLVVEDDSYLRNLYRRLLNVFGFLNDFQTKVEMAANGKEAVDVLRGGVSLNLIIMDMDRFVGQFQNSNTHKFTWFGNLPTPRSYWFVLIKLRNNTNNKTRRRRKSSLLNSSSLSHVFLSVFSLFSAFFTHQPSSSSLSIHIY